MDRLHAMQVFVRVADAGSFTKAADSLQLPRATVTLTIQRLESHLGTRLLHRTTRRMNLTPDGAIYLERCRRLLADLDETETLFSSANHNPKGKLKIDLPGRLARLVIIPALPEFHSRYPNIELQLGVSDRPIDLIQEGVDSVVRVGDLADSSLIGRRIGMMKQINCASPDYIARHGTPQNLEDLQNHVAVNYFSPLNGRVYDWEYLDGDTVKTLKLPSVVSVNNAEAYVACCLAGLGLIQAPSYDTRHHVAKEELVEILPGYRAAPMPVSVLYPHNRHLSPKVKVFVDWVANLLREKDAVMTPKIPK